MLYKYLAPNNWTLENVSRRQFIARHYTDFNDPFEFWSQVRSGLPDRDKERDRYLRAIEVWGGNESDEQAVPEFFEDLGAAQPDFVGLYDLTRIVCFASASDNLLMWSHYADGLRGICIGFDENALVTSEDVQICSVRYSDRPPIVDTFVYAVAQDQLDYHQDALAELTAPDADYQRVADESFALMMSTRQDAFACKPLEWSYEQEKRLLFFSEGGGTAPIFPTYPAEAVKEIVVGQRMPAAYRAQLEEAFERAGIRVDIRTATRSPDSYSVLVR